MHLEQIIHVLRNLLNALFIILEQSIQIRLVQLEFLFLTKQVSGRRRQIDVEPKEPLDLFEQSDQSFVRVYTKRQVGFVLNDQIGLEARFGVFDFRLPLTQVIVFERVHSGQDLVVALQRH